MVRPLYEQLGRLVAEAGELDDALFNLHWVATQKPRHEVIEELRRKMLGDMAKDVVKAYRASVSDVHLLARLDEIEEPLNLAIIRRNEFVHAVYSVVSPQRVVIRERRLRDRAVEQHVTMKYEELDLAIEQVADVRTAVNRLVDDTVQLLGSPPQPGDTRDGSVLPDPTEREDWTK